jgi:glycosyltransferase involved in cell wall biosynthesis
MQYYYKDVTLLVTHYNRSSSLERLLKTFQEQSCRFEDIVVSDDGSKPEHLQVLKVLKEKYCFQLITTPVNKGLGNNINKGQDAVKTSYTLYVQEDFVPKATFAVHFQDALDIMTKESDWDIIRFYAYFRYPYLKPHGKGFSEMVFKKMPWYANHLKFYYYSDHPHLRRSTFLTKFGRYTEGKNVDITEFTMCLSFIHEKGKGLFLDNFTYMFDQENSSSEPSTATHRSNWKLSKKSEILLLRWFYLKYKLIKNSLQYAFFQRQF